MGGMDPLGDIMGTSAGPERGESETSTTEEIHSIQNNHWYFKNIIKIRELQTLIISIIGTLCLRCQIMDEKEFSSCVNQRKNQNYEHLFKYSLIPRSSSSTKQGCLVRNSLTKWVKKFLLTCL